MNIDDDELNAIGGGGVDDQYDALEALAGADAEDAAIAAIKLDAVRGDAANDDDDDNDNDNDNDEGKA